MAANGIERHGQKTGWRVTESEYRQAERNGRSCTEKRNSGAHSNASNTKQDTTDVTVASVQQTNKTREKETLGVLNAEKVIMSNMEVSDVKERRERPDAYSVMRNLHSEPSEGERDTASGVPNPGVQKKIYTNMWAGIAQSAWRLTPGWTVRGSNPGGGEIFRTRSHRI
jgi:hypothetical protein